MKYMLYMKGAPPMMVETEEPDLVQRVFNAKTDQRPVLFVNNGVKTMIDAAEVLVAVEAPDDQAVKEEGGP